MFDKALVRSLLIQVRQWFLTIEQRTQDMTGPADFVATEEGRQTFDSICMLFIAAGENLKRIDQITDGSLLVRYPQADWRGAMGFRDVIAHQYFQIDPEEVFAILQDNITPLVQGLDWLIGEVS